MFTMVMCLVPTNHTPITAEYWTRQLKTSLPAAPSPTFFDTCVDLKPATFMTIATPHLGVRRFTYVPTPRFLEIPLSELVAGQTGKELFLADVGPEKDGGIGGQGAATKPLVFKMATSEV